MKSSSGKTHAATEHETWPASRGKQRPGRNLAAAVEKAPAADRLATSSSAEKRADALAPVQEHGEPS
jgi:hypothetical protein